MCQERRKRALSVLVIVFFIATFDYLAQGGWILWVSTKSEREIDKCRMVEKLEPRSECYENYIHERNKHALIGVNGYLATIILLLGVGGYNTIRERRERGKKC